MHIARQKKDVSETALLATAKQASRPRGFIEHLRFRVEKKQAALIAEIKKASPSKGIIREDFEPASIARSYALGGAHCLSVLTDEPFFQGADDYLVYAREAAMLPVLRKDFMLEPYQVIESRALGADAVLLIMAALSDTQAKELEKTAHELGMDVLVEVHDAEEMQRALTHLTSPLIGINNRNLKTLEVDLTTAETLAPMLPADKIGVCESGIGTYNDILRMQKKNLHVFLVGESLMREANIMQATQTLLGKAARQ